MKFDISDVARINGLQIIKRTKGAETFCVCPFCGDRRGKFSYVINKGKKSNIYRCFSCEAGGNMFDLHKKLTGESFESATDIAKDIYKKLGDTPAEKTYVPDKIEEADRATDKEISDCYYALLKELTLKPEHLADLKRRGFSDADIKRFRFKSTPKDTWKVCRNLYYKKVKMRGVPGFYMKNGKWDLRICGDGYLCPVFDADTNYITGFQIRVDKPISKSKYLWVSSAGMKFGVGSGAKCTLLSGKRRDIVVITEGVLKATIIFTLLGGEVTVVGIPGISSLGCLSEVLDRFKGQAYVIEAFDMDKKETSEVLKLSKEMDERHLSLDDVKSDEHFHKLVVQRRIWDASEKLRETLSCDFGLNSHSLIWDYKDCVWSENYKGLDDFLCANPDMAKPMLKYFDELQKKDAKLRAALEKIS